MTTTPTPPTTASAPADLRRVDQPEIDRAMAAIAKASAQVSNDPRRPAYHFLPPAQWNNDPNGTLYHDGWYHLFYQHNPFAPEWGHIHWGHARSRDLVNWEHLPVGLTPSPDRGEAHCWSGCACVNDEGQPLIFYTSVGPDDKRDPLDSAQQWVAEGDADLLTWTKPAGNPFLDESMHRGQKIYDWRDPYVFRHGGKAYMVLGGNLNRRAGGAGCVVMYEAEDLSLRTWNYRGVIYEHPDLEVVQFDCPNLIEIDGRWVLVFSPWHGAMRYIVGELDFDAARFTPGPTATFDHGPDLFASNTFLPPDGRRLIISWVRGYHDTQGWRGCMSVPRELSLGERGELIQQPVAEIDGLFAEARALPDFEVAEGAEVTSLRGREFDLRFRLVPGSSRRCGVRLMCDSEGSHGAAVSLTPDGLDVAGVPVYSIRRGGDETLDVRILADRSVIEVYLRGGRDVVTRVVHPRPDDDHLAFYADGGACRVENLEFRGLR